MKMFKLSDGSVIPEDELIRRQSEDFKFLVLAQAKHNMGMYRMLRDSAIDGAVPVEEVARNRYSTLGAFA
jgi:hypothetical protein